MQQEVLTLRGVALLLFSNRGHILTNRELESKPLIRKQSGMIAPPMETLELDEHPNEGVLRLTDEEIGVEFVSAIRELRPFGSFSFEHPECRVLIHAYSAFADYEFISRPTDHDVEHYEWLSRETLLSHPLKRIEVQQIVTGCPPLRKNGPT
jgi:ADP-ribose pyrophosphatase YjhB (NUDIX family)